MDQLKVQMHLSGPVSGLCWIFSSFWRTSLSGLIRTLDQLPFHRLSTKTVWNRSENAGLNLLVLLILNESSQQSTHYPVLWESGWMLASQRSAGRAVWTLAAGDSWLKLLRSSWNFIFFPSSILQQLSQTHSFMTAGFALACRDSTAAASLLINFKPTDFLFSQNI